MFNLTQNAWQEVSNTWTSASNSISQHVNMTAVSAKVGEMSSSVTELIKSVMPTETFHQAFQTISGNVGSYYEWVKPNLPHAFFNAGAVFVVVGGIELLGIINNKRRKVESLSAVLGGLSIIALTNLSKPELEASKVVAQMLIGTSVLATLLSSKLKTSNELNNKFVLLTQNHKLQSKT
jgi:hypothetical protein